MVEKVFGISMKSIEEIKFRGSASLQINLIEGLLAQLVRAHP
jgi:hypothetical protein